MANSTACLFYREPTNAAMAKQSGCIARSAVGKIGSAFSLTPSL
jgi:hypothetical protein